MRLLALFGPFTHQNDRFPNPFTYFDLWNPFNFIYLKPEKGTPFGRSLPVWAIIERIPGGFWNHCRLFRTGAQGWNSEGKITYFCVKQDTIDTVSKVTATFQYSLCESFEPRRKFHKEVEYSTTCAIVIFRVLTVKIIAAQVVETAVTVNNNSPQDYFHTQPTDEYSLFHSS